MTTYTNEQIATWLDSMKEPRSVANSIFQDAFELTATAIVAQQQDRIKELETTLRDIALQCEFATDTVEFRVLIQAKAKAPLGGAA